MATITFDRATKVYDDGTRAVSELDLVINDGELVVLVGPSGCGKTTALRMIAGLEDVTDGSLWIGERIVNDLAPRERDIAMVFQNYALYPHLSVFDNIAFGLRLRKTPKAEVKQRVPSVAAKLGLATMLERKPRALSGGQRQRVAMGRAIVREPQAFLMDEPLSNLDAKLRVEMRAEIIRLQRELGATMVYVTHDQVEAMTMGDRVAVLRKGELQQVAPPEEIYGQPVNLFVATFIGSPTMNAIEATIEAANGDFYASSGEQCVKLDDATLAARPALRSYVGRALILGIRPEHLEDASLLREPDSNPGRLRGTVELRETLGSDILAHIRVEAAPARSDDLREVEEDVGGPPVMPDDQPAVLVCRLAADSRLAEGQAAELAFQPRRLSFFDRDSGAAI